MAIYNALSPSWSAWSIFNQADDEFKWCPQIFDGLLQKIYEKPYLFCDRIPCQRSTQIKIRGDEVMCDNSRAFKGIFYRGTISERDQNLILNLVSPWPDTPGAICPSEEKRSSQRHSCNLKYCAEIWTWTLVSMLTCIKNLQISVGCLFWLVDTSVVHAVDICRYLWLDCLSDV